MIVRTYKYWMKPNKAAEKHLSELLETNRRIYNEGLHYCILGYEFYGKAGSPSKKDIYRYFSAKRKVDPYLAAVNTRIISYTIRHLDQSFKNFFRRVKQGKGKAGFPKFKGKDFFNTFSSDSNNGYELIQPEDGSRWGKLKLRYSSNGKKDTHNVRVKFHRPIPEEAVQKQIKLTRDGKRWYIAITLELPESYATPCGSEVTGIDVGLKTFAVDANGDEYGKTRTLEERLPELRRLNRGLARKTNKQSNRRRRHKDRLSAMHRKIRNTRRDIHNKVAKQLLDKNAVIGVEDLNIAGLTQSNLSRRIADAGWGNFLLQLEGAAEQRGAKVVKVPAKNTTQACSGCGEIVKKELKDRIHDCPHCGLKIDRDHNAAINIKNRAVEILAAEDKPKTRKSQREGRADLSGANVAGYRKRSPKTCKETIGKTTSKAKTS